MWSVAKVLNDLLDTQFSETENQDEYKLCCPFHEENDPSFQMDSEGRYICFGCGVRGGWLPQFIAALYNIPLFDPAHYCALDMLEEGMTGHSWVQGKADVKKHAKIFLREHAVKNLASATDYAQQNFYGDPKAYTDWDHPASPGMGYMLSRGYLAATMREFGVTDWQRFPEHPLFIPLAYNGVVFGYVQRRINDKYFPKYLSMIGMQKSDHLHGYADPWDTVVLVTEGPFDIMMVWQYGWTQKRGYGAVAILGSSVSAQQAELLAACGDVFLSGFDMDEAGEKAHQSLCAMLAPYQKTIIRLVLPCQGLSTVTRSDFWIAVKLAVKSETLCATA